MHFENSNTFHIFFQYETYRRPTTNWKLHTFGCGKCHKIDRASDPKMPAVETMALWVAVVTLGAQIKAMAGTGKREREKVRLLREQAENTRRILKLLEDSNKQQPTSPDPAMAGVLAGLRGALDDISSSPEKKKNPGDFHALDQRISSILQQYHHYYHVANNCWKFGHNSAYFNPKY